MPVAVFAEVSLSLGLCSGSKNQSFAQLGVVLGIVTSVSIATCGSWSRTWHLRAEVGTGELGAALCQRAEHPKVLACRMETGVYPWRKTGSAALGGSAGGTALE